MASMSQAKEEFQIKTLNSTEKVFPHKKTKNLQTMIRYIRKFLFSSKLENISTSMNRLRVIVLWCILEMDAR